jgi:hypothetical protein
VDEVRVVEFVERHVLVESDVVKDGACGVGGIGRAFGDEVR